MQPSRLRNRRCEGPACRDLAWAIGKGAAIGGLLVLAGCSEGVLDPKGPIGAAEKTILIDALVIMLCIVLPVIFGTLFVAWWFRSSNKRAHYRPHWDFSGRIEIIIWSIPALTVLLLGGIGWVGAHDLDPPKPIASPVKPIEVQVVSLDWKWLFIYPEQGIASVNQLVVPAGTPISFRLTSASVMNAFFVPELGTQIYTMAGMTTRLNLLADKPGRFMGLSSMFSGDGFSGMRFAVTAVPPNEFTAWAARARASGGDLTSAAYTALARPSSYVKPTIYRSVEPGLFDSIVNASSPAMAANDRDHEGAGIVALNLNQQGK